MKPELDFAELFAFVRRWKKRNEEYTGLRLEVSLDVKGYEQGAEQEALGLEVDRV